MGAGGMCGLNSPFPAPGADDVHRQIGIGPTSLLLTKEEPGIFIIETYHDELGVCLLFLGTHETCEVNKHDEWCSMRLE